MAGSLSELAPTSPRLFQIEIGDLPLYNEDLETAAAPAQWTRFRQEVMSADAILFVTPEYNRSIPGALKNALDVGSRPWGERAASCSPSRPGWRDLLSANSLEGMSQLAILAA